MATNGNTVEHPVYFRINGDNTSLAMAYFNLKKESLFSKVFWHLPQPSFQTIDEFLIYFSDMSVVSIYCILSNDKVAGYLFVDDLIPPHHCRVGCAFMREFWGDFPQEFGEKVLPEMHEKLGVERIYAFTPWKAAFGLAERLGMYRAGLIKEYASGLDVHILVHRKDKDSPME